MNNLSLTERLGETNEGYIDDTGIFTILHTILQLLIFGIVLFIQIKTIIVCKKEKSKTWQIHISHAVVLSISSGYLTFLWLF